MSIRLQIDKHFDFIETEFSSQYQDFDTLITLRGLIDNAASKIDMNVRKSLKITKSEDLGWIIYVNAFDIALVLDQYRHCGELDDIVGRGAIIEDIVCMPSGIFPPECMVLDHGSIKLGVLYFINRDPKCPRCWKRHSNVNEHTGLCPRCQDVIENHYPEYLEGKNK